MTAVGMYVESHPTIRSSVITQFSNTLILCVYISGLAYFGLVVQAHAFTVLGGYGSYDAGAVGSNSDRLQLVTLRQAYEH